MLEFQMEMLETAFAENDGVSARLCSSASSRDGLDDLSQVGGQLQITAK